MKRRADRVDRADARDRDYGHDWKDHQAFQRWKKDQSSLELILHAKATANPAALAMLLSKRNEESEEGGEALDAVFVIIQKNPGNRDVLGLVPSLVMNMLSPEREFDSAILLSAIAEANPDSHECKRWEPEIIEAIHELLEKEDTVDVRMALSQHAVTLGFLGGERALATLNLLLECKYSEIGSDFERDVLQAIERIHR